MSTPRPSISPLSNAFESIKGSPSILRSEVALEKIGDAHIRNAQDDDADDEDKDDSSVLSEPEDVDDDDDSIDHDRARGKDEIDSEAETERLELTPRHTREAAGLGRTPSKLSRLQQLDDDDLSDAPSPLPAADNGAASSTSTEAIGGKKRKRTSELDSPLTSEPDESESPRKRVGNLQGGSPLDDADKHETADAISSIKVSKSKVKGRRGRPERDETKDTEEAEEEPTLLEQEAEAQQAEEDAAQKTEAMDAFAELAKQFTAFRDALYTERLASVEAELALLEQPQCQHPEYLRMAACVQQRRLKQDRETRAFYHYRQIATQHKILAERAQLHSQYFQTAREIREESLDTLGKAWYSIHRERRQGVEVNPADELRHVYRYVDKRGDLLRQQAKYNREVSILAGVAKYVGFPAAPDISGIEGDKLDEDLRAMKLVRPMQQNTMHPQHSRPYNMHGTPSNVHPYLHRQQELASATERNAHDRFVEQHAWARAPQSHAASLVSTPNISHTPEWAGFRKPAQPPKDHADIDHGEGGAVSGTPYAAVPDSAEQRRDIAQPESSPLQVPKQRLNGNESNGWRNYSGTSTIDAPLVDNHTNLNSDEASAKKIELPPMETSQLYDNRTNMATSLFPAEKADMFRTAGFRPLDGSFVAPASSTHGVGGG